MTAAATRDRSAARVCLLQLSSGSVEECPAGECPFWEPGGAVISGGCAVERLGLGIELERNPQLAHWLLKVRARLEDAGEAHLVYELLSPELRP